MAYLVRRLLENTSNESFVRHRFAEGRALDELVAPPTVAEIPGPTQPPGRRAHGPAPTRPPYEPEPLREWRRGSARAAFSVAIDKARDDTGIEVPALHRRRAGRARPPRSRRSTPPRSTG